jgi:hypothetical protein
MKLDVWYSENAGSEIIHEMERMQVLAIMKENEGSC